MAKKKISAFTEATSIDVADLIPVVINPATVPASRKVASGNIFKTITSENNILVAASDSPDSIKAIANYTCDGTDDDVQINAAIAALPAAGGVVVLGPGNFVAEGITLAEGVQIKGAGVFNTKISLPASATTAMFVAGAVAEFNGGCISDMQLYGDVGATQNGIDFSACTVLSEFFIERCKISNFATGIHGTAATGNDRFLVVSDCEIWYCTIGMYGEEHPRLHNVDFRFNTTGLTGRWNDGALSYCRFAYNTNGFIPTAGQAITDTVIQNCFFYNNSTVALEIASYCTITGCQIYGYATGTHIGAKVTGSANTITGCLFGTNNLQCRGGAIVLANSTNLYSLTLVGNTIYCAGAGGLVEAGSASLAASNISGNAFNVAAASYGIDCNAVYLSNNVIANNVFRLVATATGVRFKANNASAGNQFLGNLFRSESSVTAVGVDGDMRAAMFVGNRASNVSTLLTLQNSDANTIIAENSGYVTRADGTATIASGATSVEVTHGLAGTPTAADIQVTPTNDLGGAAKFWISDVGAATFKINVNTDPGATTATFCWQARIF